MFMQLALYRAERPEVFDEIIGQKHIVRILQNQIKTGTVSQAYLFSGTHGTGKTSTARILAKAVNCLEADAGGSVPCGHCANCEAIREGRFVDVVELDAASNNGVDDLRAITDMAKYPPTVGKYKVYIIDEVHMLSQAAENAFLKTLEEPPEHCIFILATTDPQKVRATIRSRCMELGFRRVSEEELMDGMQRICDKKDVQVTPDALGTIAARADGSVRDALSILEQCMAAGDTVLDKKLVLEYTGAAGEDFYIALTDAVTSGDLGKALLYIDEMSKRGKDARQLLKDWLEHYRNLLIIKYLAKPGRIISASEENLARLKAQADRTDAAEIDKAIRLISEYINIGRYSDRPRILLETAAVRLAGTDSFVPKAASQQAQPAKAPARAHPEARSFPASGQNARAEVKAQPAAAEPSAADNEALMYEAMAAEADGEFPYEMPEAVQTAEPAETSEPAAAAAEPEAPAETAVPEPAPAPAPLKAGNAAEMWNRIADELAKGDRSFASMVGRHSAGANYEGSELTVIVRPNKLWLAIEKTDEIDRLAKAMYGPDVYVTLKAGGPDDAKGAAAAGSKAAAPAQPEPATAEDIAGRVQELFNVDVNITDN